ncbi:DUF3800 domain-containing protein, partial [Methanobrevibacter sp. OttesenSCG-928-K11]|nr:DUF3800 domain-containing protein [Methanobrevibacter sp. OttesenSCG-928-K11]
FNNMFLRNLKNENNVSINVFHSYSQNFKGLQIVDCVCWAYFQKYEHKNDEYINLLKLKSICKII